MTLKNRDGCGQISNITVVNYPQRVSWVYDSATLESAFYARDGKAVKAFHYN